MKQKLLKIGALLFLTFALASLHAQEGILASGGDAVGSGGSSSYSVGQLAFHVFTGSQYYIVEGMQQPFEISERRVGIMDDGDISLSFSAYPNPTTDHLILKADYIDLSELSFKLFDLTGRMLKNERITSNETIIDMNDLASANYFLQVIRGDAALIVFKIVKN